MTLLSNITLWAHSAGKVVFRPWNQLFCFSTVWMRKHCQRFCVLIKCRLLLLLPVLTSISDFWTHLWWFSLGMARVMLATSKPLFQFYYRTCLTETLRLKYYNWPISWIISKCLLKFLFRNPVQCINSVILILPVIHW